MSAVPILPLVTAPTLYPTPARPLLRGAPQRIAVSPPPPAPPSTIAADPSLPPLLLPAHHLSMPSSTSGSGRRLSTGPEANATSPEPRVHAKQDGTPSAATPDMLRARSGLDSPQDVDVASLFFGDFIQTSCDTTALLPLYMEESDPVVDDHNNPLLDLQALQWAHPAITEYTRNNPRRSLRVLPNARKREPEESLESCQKKARSCPDTAAGSLALPRTTKRGSRPPVPKVKDARGLQWMKASGELLTPSHSWTIRPATTALPDLAVGVLSNHTVAAQAQNNLAIYKPSPAIPPRPSFPLPARSLHPLPARPGLPILSARAPNPTLASRPFAPLPPRPLLLTASQALPAIPSSSDQAQHPHKKSHRGGKARKLEGGAVNPERDAMLVRRAFRGGDVITSTTFSLLHDASISPAGFQGIRPPKLARNQIRQLYHLKPDAAALRDHLNHFFPLPYVEGRAVFVLDKDGHLFFNRTTPAKFLEGREEEIEYAIALLAGKDLTCPKTRAKFKGEDRGPHCAMILGHHRQSRIAPELTGFHRSRLDDAQTFMNLPIMIRIFDWVKSIIRILFPRIAARFEEDAAWHEKEYNIRPLFGYFWNFCLNVVFPGQERIHTGPHTDFKNQIGVCSILTYLLKSGAKFDHKRRSWIVIWELGMRAQLVPWTLASYPSALFLHFNVDVHQLRFVHTAEDVELPTPENSTPIVSGDDTGRGSMVFFNQATMRHGPVFGVSTRKMAAAGQNDTPAFGSDVSTAFQMFGIVQAIPQHVVDGMGDNPPKRADLEPYLG
ncbi:hypothetical protein MVEN_02368400 [Mycena venus]|uniref:Uncharacterized protein n=1 Tax=Mycena venus TaxID=2733690 RepID=A0A8H7CEZ5_9AGAR|nr:hypothetical protein MVEN_02368400 [Mycena venus]